MRFDSELLQSVYGINSKFADSWFPYLQSALSIASINSNQRLACFLAQIGHESARLKFVRELWNPSTCLWQQKYEGSKSLGNSQPGDGFKFRGRGLIQITGRSNYAKMSDLMGLPLLQAPELLEKPKYAANSAAYFWQWKNLNSFCDLNDFEGLTRKINGGTNGLDDRLNLYNTAIHLLEMS